MFTASTSDQKSVAKAQTDQGLGLSSQSQPHPHDRFNVFCRVELEFVSSAQPSLTNALYSAWVRDQRGLSELHPASGNLAGSDME